MFPAYGHMLKAREPGRRKQEKQNLIQPLTQAGAGPSLPQPTAQWQAPQPPSHQPRAASAPIGPELLTCALCCTRGLNRHSLLEHLRGRAHDLKLRQRMATLAGAVHSVILTLPPCSVPRAAGGTIAAVDIVARVLGCFSY